MKTLFTTTFLFAMAILILFPKQSFSQSGTMTIYANSSSTLDQIINGDVTNGINNHSVYQLVSTDTTYLLDATITSQASISIIGVPDPSTGKLPCIEVDVLSDNSIPGIFFTFTGQGTRVVLKNLYLLGIAPNNVNNTALGQGVQVSADSLSLTVDNCVFDMIAQFEIGYSSHWNKFYITNSKFRNGIDVATAYYVPELLRSQNYNGIWNTDTVYIKYNTLLGVAMGPVVTTGITNYFEFSHNDAILLAKGPIWSEHIVNGKLNDNLFYDVYATGVSKTEYFGGWDEIAPPRIPSIFYFDNLDSSAAALLLGHPITGQADYDAAEAARNIEIKNNAYFWSSGLTDFWTAWNDTATVDSIITPVFMNNESMAMFNDDTKWPGLVLSGNQNVDPGFGPTIEKTLNPGADTTYGVGLLAWIAAVRGGTGTTEYYSYQKTQVGTEADWTPIWPLPESVDLAYSNTALQTGATDGGPVGDPYWFTGTPTGIQQIDNVVPAKYNLAQNYPNPFNPSTVINYSIPKGGLVTLSVYNLLGQEVATLVNEQQAAGSYEATFNASQLSSGVYFYTLKSNSITLTKKMLLLK